MFDPTLITKCADPDLAPGIIERFVAEAGSPNPLKVTVKSGDRLILVPLAKTSAEAMAIVSKYVGHAVVRVGVTQYPAGIGVKDPSELRVDLLDACDNIRAGTGLFAKVYRIVTKWYGSQPPEAFDDAVHAWRTGYFEGKSVFHQPDPEKPGRGAANTKSVNADDIRATTDALGLDVTSHGKDPASADTRVNLSRINGSQ